jgi:hypothetical protein
MRPTNPKTDSSAVYLRQQRAQEYFQAPRPRLVRRSPEAAFALRRTAGQRRKGLAKVAWYEVPG